MYIMLKAFKSFERYDYKQVASTLMKQLEDPNKTKWADLFLKSIYENYTPEKRKQYIKRFLSGKNAFRNLNEDSLENYLHKINTGVSFGSDALGEWNEDSKGLAIYDWILDNQKLLGNEKFKKTIKFAKLDSIDKLKKEKSDYGYETKKNIRNNTLFDILWAVLTHPDTFSKMFNPLSFDEQKRSARIINIIKATNKYTYDLLSKIPATKDGLDLLDKILAEAQKDKQSANILTPMGLVYFHKQNMTAGKLIGVFANNNTSHAFISMQDIRLVLNKEKEFTFNGKRIRSGLKIDALKSNNGNLMSKTIAGFLAASVDAVKDPVLNYMNLNTMTAGVAMTLVRMGFDSDSVGLFLTLPYIEKLTSLYFKRNNEGYISIDLCIQELINEIQEELGNKKASKTAKDTLAETLFTKEEMALMISIGNNQRKQNKDYLEYQLRTLMLFKQLTGIALKLNTVTFMTKFNSVTNAVGPTIADTMVMKYRIDKFINDELEDPTFSGVVDKNRNILLFENSPLLKSFYETTMTSRGASEKIFAPYFPHYSTTFLRILNEINNTTRSTLDAKTINKLVSDWMLFKLTLEGRNGEEPVLNFDEETRAYLIKKFPNEVAFEKARMKSAGEMNELLQIIQFLPADKKVPEDTLRANSGGFSVDTLETIKSSWGDMANSNTRKQRELAKKLFLYNILRCGFTFSPKGFLHLASVDTKLAMENDFGYLSSIQNPYFNDSRVNALMFIELFRRNNYKNGKVVVNIDSFNLNPDIKISNRNNMMNSKSEKTTGFKISLKSDNKYGLMPIMINVNINNPLFAPMVIREDNLCELVSYTEDSVEYAKISTLGHYNNFLEYDANESSKRPLNSVIGKSYDFADDSKEDEPDGENENPEVEPEELVIEDKSINSELLMKVVNEIQKTNETLISGISNKIDRAVNNKEMENTDEALDKYMLEKLLDHYTRVLNNPARSLKAKEFAKKILKELNAC